jgi:hypothetical protein
MNNPEQQRLTIEDIHALIRSRTEESLTLEYKAAGALALTAKRDFRDEISKDVSSMANSAGGRIIYGVSADPINSWFPGELDPVERSSITIESLQQIISSRIQPKIQGVNIYAVPITEEKAVYVVDIPQSTTAHQASDKKYYKRVNNISQPMEDYEIRDVMNRKSGITLSLRIIPDLTRDQVRTESTITMNCGMHFLISVHNSGTRVAQYCLAELSADQHVIDESTGESYFTGTETRVRQIFTFSNDRIIVRPGGGTGSLKSGRYHPILPSCELRLGWITIRNRPVKSDAGKRGLTFFSAEDYRLLWKLFSEEGQTSSAEINIRDLVAQHDATSERVRSNAWNSQ